MLKTSVSLSKEVVDYYESRRPDDSYRVDWSYLANYLLDNIDYSVLPPVTEKSFTKAIVFVDNPMYETLYKKLGPYNKQVSLARLFAFGRDIDVLSKMLSRYLGCMYIKKQNNMSMAKKHLFLLRQMETINMSKESKETRIKFLQICLEYGEFIKNADWAES